MNLEELKQWTTDRLDYEDNEIGKEHSEYRGHYYAGVLALLAKLEAAQKQVEASAKRDKIKIDVINRANARIAELEKKLRDEYDDYPALAAFDKEQQ